MAGVFLITLLAGLPLAITLRGGSEGDRAGGRGRGRGGMFVRA